jgi:TolB-like protein
MTRPSHLHVVPNATATASSYQPFAGHPPAVVESAVDRILASATFRRSQRHRNFLRHVVDAALNGRHEELKEIVIGLEVFDRDIADYDPRSDPIVRVEAGRVREKLDRYYANEGVADPFEIQIPVGGYLPQLSRRVAKPAARNLGSYAVLPFASLSSNADDAIFCEALADQMIDLLSRVPGVRVVGRMSAIKARAQSADMKVLGKLLGVNHVVEGSIQRSGSRCRCVAQVFRTRDRVCIWSQRFESAVGDSTDLFAFQDRIADAVIAAIAQPEATAATTTSTASNKAASGNPEARDLYERARYLVQLRSNEGLEKGIALLERSIALDPEFAPAHTQLGIARSAYYGVMARPTLTAFREVEQSARRALELDPLDADARALIANIVFRVDRDWRRAEPLFREALRVGPNSASAHHSYAQGLVFNGRFLEAIEHARIALDLDPLNITVRINLAVITSYARDYQTAIEEFTAVLDIEPDHFFAHFMLGSVYLWAGAADPAMKHFEIACALVPDHPIPQFDRIFVYGLRGEHARGREMLAALLAKLEGKNYQLYNRAMAEAYLRDVTALCATLRRVAARHELLFVSLPADPSFDPYRDHPEFIALMNEYGLPCLPPSPFASRYLEHDPRTSNG